MTLNQRTNCLIYCLNRMTMAKKVLVFRVLSIDYD